MEITAYISINLLLFAAWYILLFRKRERLSFVDRLIAAFVLGLTQIIITEILLGILFKKLYATPLFLFNVVVSSGVLILAARPLSLGNIFNEIKDETARFFRIIKRDRVLFCIFSLFFISIGRLVFSGYLFPSYAWDALWYHLPIVGYIMQSGAIEQNLPPSFINQFINIFPKNIELFFLWNTIFLKSDVIVDLSQLFFTLAGVVTVYSMALKLKIRGKYAIYSSLLFFFTPIIILQSTVNYTDIAVSVLFLIAINFLMYDDPENYTGNKRGLTSIKDSNIPIILSGLTAGLLIGSKASGPLYIVVLSAVVLTREFIRHFKPFNIATGMDTLKHRGGFIKDGIVPYLVCFLAPAFLVGGYWYLRNWVLYNNPVYPVEVSLFNITLFEGMHKGAANTADAVNAVMNVKTWGQDVIIDPVPEIINNLSPLRGLFYVWIEKIKYYIYDSRLGGFGPVWFILFLPSLVFSLAHGIKRKRYNFLFISAVLILTFILYPRNWNTRYVIFIVGLGALSFGLALDYFNRRENALRIIALLLAGYTFLTVNSPCITPGKIKEFILLPSQERTIARLAPFNIDEHARQEYGYWIWINNNISKGDTLAYTFEPLFLAPLWNREFSNKVVYIKSDTYKEWLKKLENIHATYILIKKDSIEDEWIEKERNIFYSLRWMGNITERFRIVYADKKYKIVRFYEGGRQKNERGK